MNLVLLTLMAFAPQVESDQACYTGSIKIGRYIFTENDVVSALDNQVNATVVTVANTNAEFANYLKHRGNCQARCLGTVMKLAFSTLYGKFGQDFLSKSKHIQDTFVDAFTGAFRACYPFPPSEGLKRVAQGMVRKLGDLPHSIISSLGSSPPKVSFPAGVTCPNHGHEADFPLTDFLTAFESKFRKVTAKIPEMQKFFDTEAKDCQKTCLQKAVASSALTLFLAGNDDDDSGIDALTGAIHTCFPGVPDINVLVSDEKGVVEHAESEAEEEERYEEAQNSGSWSFFSSSMFVMVVSMALFAAGVAWGRSKRDSSRVVPRQVETYALLGGGCR